MKNFFLSFLIIITTTALPNFALAETAIQLATDHWPPYVYSQGNSSGFFSEIVIEAFKAVNEKVAINYYPWKRCEALVEEGKVWGTFPYSISPERLKKFEFSNKIVDGSDGVFYNKRKFPKGLQLNSFADFSNYHTSGIRGYWYEPYFKEAKVSVAYSSSEEIALKNLFNERTDLVVSNALLTLQIIQQQFASEEKQIEMAKLPLAEDRTLRMMILKNTPKNQELLKKFNKGLEIIIKNGVYKKILEKYRIDKSIWIGIDL